MVDTSVSRSAAVPTAPPDGGYVEWGPVIAGGLLAAALSFVLLTFGTAIGLSFVSPWSGSSLSPRVIASLAVFWTLAQQIASAMAGGYVAGRMRSRWQEATADEVEFRDGLHGGLVWAIAVIVGAMLVASAVSGIARTVTQTAGSVAGAAATNASQIAYDADTMLRGNPGAQGGTSRPAATPEQRAEVGRILSRSLATGSLSDSDRSYLAGLVAQNTGMSQQDAEKRVNDTFAAASKAAKDAAETARRSGIVTGLVTAIGLLVSLAASWWAGIRGGHHRDNAIHPKLFDRNRRPM